MGKKKGKKGKGGPAVKKNRAEEWMPSVIKHASLGNKPMLQSFLTPEVGGSGHSYDEDGHTALHAACSRGHTDCARLLLYTGAVVEHYNSQGWTALHSAVVNDKACCARLLLGTGASADTLTKCSMVSPLHMAIARSSMWCVVILTEERPGTGAGAMTAKGPGGLDAMDAALDALDLARSALANFQADKRVADAAGGGGGAADYDEAPGGASSGAAEVGSLEEEETLTLTLERAEKVVSHLNRFAHEFKARD